MGFVRWFLAEPRWPRFGREDHWAPASSHFRSVRGGTMSSNPPSSSGESANSRSTWSTAVDRKRTLAVYRDIAGSAREIVALASAGGQRRWAPAALPVVACCQTPFRAGRDRINATVATLHPDRRIVHICRDFLSAIAC
jgi:hypothetical protein